MIDKQIINKTFDKVIEDKCSETREDIIELKETIKSNDFVGVVFMNGHEHTVKAYGEILGVPPEYDNDGKLSPMQGQIKYIKFVEKNEDTELDEILSANSEEEALDNDILDDSNQYEDGRYWIK